MTHAIEIEGLSKVYNDEVHALKDINLKVESGEIFGLIGPDGAGKSSLMRILATLLYPTKGWTKVLDKDCVKDYKYIRNNIGYMPGKFSLYEDLSIKENLEFYATVFGTTLDKAYDHIKEVYVQIEPFKDRKAGDLSGGMKQKLGLCAALIHRPKVLFLDEPTTGVDPVSRKEFWDLIESMNQQGLTVFVSTPYMDEALRCHRIALINQGVLMEVDSPQKITEAFKQSIYAVSGAKFYDLINTINDYPNKQMVYPYGEVLHYLDATHDADAGDKLLAYLKEKGFGKAEVRKVPAGIEDVFIHKMEVPNE